MHAKRTLESPLVRPSVRSPKEYLPSRSLGIWTPTSTVSPSNEEIAQRFPPHSHVRVSVAAVTVSVEPIAAVPVPVVVPVCLDG